jgi:hypothetical protein
VIGISGGGSSRRPRSIKDSRSRGRRRRGRRRSLSDYLDPRGLK